MALLLRRLMSVRRGPSDPFRQLFNDILAPLEQLPSIVSPARHSGLTAFDIHRIRADVHETNSEYIVEAEVPGVQREDLSIDLHDNDRTLSISGRQEIIKDSKDNHKESKRRTWFSERLSGEFRRVFTFEDPIKGDHIKAELKDGVLKVTVPKAQPTQNVARKIEIEEKTT